ncbi:PQQ-dependent sugar dehydrogenase [Streptomyces sp. 4N509B]|uniref:PQQ-dependent sugar dehydrogenase n=1 Tax=Streptomyces sp. 4N509B TaxID=3457413 RepID=UPI003FD27D4E
MSPRHWTGGLALAAALAVLIPLASAHGEAADEATEPPSTAAVPLDQLAATSTQVGSGLSRPTAIAAPDDGTQRLFITEKRGTVRVYHPDDGLAEEPLFTIADVVDNSQNERGLLGIATPADFADSQELYLAYTALPDGAVTLARYSLADGSLEPLLSQEHAEYGNHNGGQLAFDADGLLYWGIGDGGGSGDPFDTGQRVDTLLGKILRLDVSTTCGELPYCVPEDNPFVGVEGAREEIWAYGLRNPWRFSFDPADNSLWIGDVGQGQQEEINHLAPNRGGANLGWSCREGSTEYDPEQCPQNPDFTEPVHSYPLTGGNCAVIGGVVYRGEQYADLAEGTYLASDYCGATAIAIRPTADGAYETAEIGEFQTQPTAIAATADGNHLYYVNDLPGGLHRIEFQQAN